MESKTITVHFNRQVICVQPINDDMNNLQMLLRFEVVDFPFHIYYSFFMEIRETA